MSYELLESAIGRKFSAGEILHRRIMSLPGRVTRVVHGPLAGAVNIDYANHSLDEIESQLKTTLETLMPYCPDVFEGRNISVYRGGNHLDIVDLGKGSMHWLSVEDHLT
ncbi:hypothetical protein [Delftia acidovorans]|uniref:hypothetical protein n=1 Tax=Delftia acidovorans TaxID=80866 RepID=UPI001EDCC584|nr:hypothetical protein [Delftia acidovorans]MCG3784628.1 hypothetical protein [Delftia acidovorans]